MSPMVLQGPRSGSSGTVKCITLILLCLCKTRAKCPFTSTMPPTKAWAQHGRIREPYRANPSPCATFASLQTAWTPPTAFGTYI